MRLGEVSLVKPRWDDRGVHFIWPITSKVCWLSQRQLWAVWFQVIFWTIKICIQVPELRMERAWGLVSSGTALLTWLWSGHIQMVCTLVCYEYSIVTRWPQGQGQVKCLVKSAHVLTASWTSQRWHPGPVLFWDWWGFGLGSRNVLGLMSIQDSLIISQSSCQKFNRWRVCIYETGGRPLHCWILLHMFSLYMEI